ncbi:lipoprotein [Rhizobium sp. CFBP 8762]|uniref:LPS translocon maturation chaperone LptM n=1 Tax=Rhizobium sp. CFBP 8762 TaxID=2775279 RepID=UPI00177D4AA6|nr:lipoprotein [Rhizobium sp. CFBP 8762]MBD8555625.1 lipoprotein [Rhizobium sp. CFBP 8762]
MSFRKTVAWTLVLAALAATVAGCGRKGPLDVPPAKPVTVIDKVTGQPKQVDPDNRPFFLDPLL